MSSPDHNSASLEFPKPPTTEKKASNCATTLAWLRTNIATIYSAGRAASSQDHPPTLARSAYLDMYSTVHSFCMDAKQRSPPGGPLDGEHLYRGIKDEIKSHCTEVRTLLLASRNSAEADDARQIIEDYLAHWQMLARLAALVKNLMQPLERDWIVRNMSEKKKDVILIMDLHTVVWKREILEVGVDSTEAAAGSELERALKTLQTQGEDGSESDRDLAERFVESLKSIGVGPRK
jgi:hypothetical protein